MTCTAHPEAVTPLDVAGSMGVMLTVTTFLVGFDELRTRAFHEDLPRLSAQQVTAAIANGPAALDRPEIDEVIRENRARQRIILLLYAVLSGASCGLLLLAWFSSEGRLTELWPIAAIFSAHLIVLALGLTDQRRSARMFHRALDRSALPPFRRALALSNGQSNDPLRRRDRAAEKVAQLELALARVPADVSALGVRRLANEARLGLAESFIALRNPTGAAAALDQIDDAGIGSAEHLRQYEDGPRAAEILDGLISSRVHEAWARIAELSGQPDKAVLAWLDALRVAPERFRSFADLIADARAAGKVANVASAVGALIGDGPAPQWAPRIVNGMLAALVMGEHTEQAADRHAREQLHLLHESLEPERDVAGSGPPPGPGQPGSGDWDV